MIFEGTFKPPVMGTYESPVKITGLGSCEVTVDGLKVKGFKQTGLNSVHVAIIFFVIFFAIFILGTIAVSAGILSSIESVVLRISMAAIGVFLIGSGKDHQGDSIELLIPWNSVSNFRLDRSGAVVIRLQRFRHQGERYEGGLFFHPSDGAASIVEMLKNHDIQQHGLQQTKFDSWPHS
ncbi:MAG: spore germination protein [Cyanothece sp. SIO2G6]|nr:spore germination protein [Cyanothece sp. SIO2G6]